MKDDELRGKRERVIQKLWGLHDAVWKVLWEEHGKETRLLSAEQADQLEAIKEAAHKSIERLRDTKKPKGFRKGQNVRVLLKIEAVRSACPVPGTRGKVDRLQQNEYGWWVVVAFTEEFTDLDGTVWYPTPSNPMNIFFKPDELVIGWRKANYGYRGQEC